MLRTRLDRFELVGLHATRPGELLRFDGGQYGIVLPTPAQFRVLILGQGLASISVAWDDNALNQKVVRLAEPNYQFELRSSFKPSHAIKGGANYNGMAAIGPGTGVGVIARQPRERVREMGTSYFVDFSSASVSDFGVTDFCYASAWALYVWFANDPPSTPSVLVHEQGE